MLQPQVPAGKERGPVITAVSAPRGQTFVPQRPNIGQPALMQLGYDAAQLLAQEYRNMTSKRRISRIAELEQLLANSPAPGFQQVSMPVEPRSDQLEFVLLDHLAGACSAGRSASGLQQARHAKRC